MLVENTYASLKNHFFSVRKRLYAIVKLFIRHDIYFPGLAGKHRTVSCGNVFKDFIAGNLPFLTDRRFHLYDINPLGRTDVVFPVECPLPGDKSP